MQKTLLLLEYVLSRNANAAGFIKSWSAPGNWRTLSFFSLCPKCMFMFYRGNRVQLVLVLWVLWYFWTSFTSQRKWYTVCNTVHCVTNHDLEKHQFYLLLLLLWWWKLLLLLLKLFKKCKRSIRPHPVRDFIKADFASSLWFPDR